MKLSVLFLFVGLAETAIPRHNIAIDTHAHGFAAASKLHSSDRDTEASVAALRVAEAAFDAAASLPQQHPNSQNLRRFGGADARPSSKKCDDSSFTGTLDIVITWHTDQPQSPALKRTDLEHYSKILHRGRTLLQTGAGFENQREIMYLLRGAERFGLLNKTRMVYVIVAKDELETKGPPRDLNWEHPQLRLVSDDQIGVTGKSGYSSKFASLQNIPGIGEWILLLQDDIFPTQKWDPSGVYDFDAKRPRVRLDVDSFRAGFCGDDPDTRSPMEHGPWFVNRCHLEELEARYPNYYKRVRAAVTERDTLSLDVQCLYDNTAAKEGWATASLNQGFWTNCHINAPCPGEHCCRAATFTHPRSMFMNLQGPGVSDDYSRREDVYDAAQRWFHTEYAQPSRFEKKKTTIG